MKITLVRHTQLNISTGICYGQSEVPLAKNFTSEAEHVRVQLADDFDQVFTSPLSRCTKLAAYCEYERAIADSRLLEMNFGEWELKPWKDIYGTYAEHWMENYIQVPCPGGESLQMMVARIQEFVNELQLKSYQNILIFTHAGPIRVFHHILKQQTLENLFDVQVAYGQVISF